ncbi:hypothetical protein BPAE_0181g00110 [Botrytis paeoniae]|uniref:Uncharacterized protein n=1 Tax=Botrytis paeoniae TaxID=278948 RepID=A0A4Z1FFK2_9HELO|nr:hypothetical protein BPAE_0181g00110 [Botrytis paeoniae]
MTLTQFVSRNQSDHQNDWSSNQQTNIAYQAQLFARHPLPTFSGQFMPRINYEERDMPPVVLALQILRVQHVGLAFLCTPSTTMRLSTQ